MKDSVASSPLKKELIREKVAKDEEVENIEPEEQLQQETERQITNVEVPKSEAELKAAQLSDEAVQTYWRKVEAERMAKRVHQEHLTLSERVLRYFDVCSQYGVSNATLSLRELEFVVSVLTRQALHWRYPSEALAASPAVGP